MSFKKNDRVRVSAVTHSQLGQVGTVEHVYRDEVTFRVQMDNGNDHGFFESELELVDEKREVLIELAETLDKARLQADTVEETAPESGLYRDIEQVLVEVLCMATGRGEVGDIYDSLMDGNTVREALAKVEGK